MTKGRPLAGFMISRTDSSCLSVKGCGDQTPERMSCEESFDQVQM